MNIGIKYRLFFAMLMASLLAVVTLVGLMQWNLSRGFLHFVKKTEQVATQKLVDSLQQRYAEKQNWLDLQADPALWRELILKALLPERPDPEQQRSGPPPAGTHRSGPQMLPPPLVDDFTRRVVLLDSRQQPLTEPFPQQEASQQLPLYSGGELVGYLSFVPLSKLTDDRITRFLHEQRLTFLLVAGCIVVVAAILSFLLARRLVRPLGALAESTRRLTGGEYGSRVEEVGNDEIGSLAKDFNLLALTLENNEAARRQWIADISHELRTPIGILRGETEALLDGVRTPDAVALQSLHAEALRLGRLVDDLYQLSMSDLGALSYRKTELDLATLLAELVASYRCKFGQKSLRLDFDRTMAGRAMVFGDPERLRQLFSNLFDNSLKYTDAGGGLEIDLRRCDRHLQVNFRDTAPAVEEENLEKLFERLYRIESSRNRNTGGAGLGLAICRNIAEAHQGTITARLAESGGLWIELKLPLAGGC